VVEGDANRIRSGVGRAIHLADKVGKRKEKEKRKRKKGYYGHFVFLDYQEKLYCQTIKKTASTL